MPAPRLSRYEFAPVEVDEQGRPFLDVPEPPARVSRNDDSRPIVGEGDDLFTVAWRAYKAMLDPEQDVRPTGFFWVVAQFNDVLDAAAPLAQGRRLRVPSVEALNSEVLVPPRFFAVDEEF